jgi:23S rRNA (guanosine2251-2'-O)-methyltransferase
MNEETRNPKPEIRRKSPSEEAQPASSSLPMIAPVVLSGAHLVETVLRHGRAKPDELLVRRGGSSKGLSRLVSLAESKGVSVRFVDGEMDSDVAVSLPARSADGITDASLVLACEGIEDPRNLGDVLRSALAAGADVAVLDAHAREMPRDVVARSSAGASECLRITFADDLAAELARLRSLGIEPVAAAAEGGEDAFRMKWPAKLALVIGGERRGLSRATLEACPRLVTIPMPAGLQSLSASAGAAVLLFDATRRRAVSR